MASIRKLLAQSLATENGPENLDAAFLLTVGSSLLTVALLCFSCVWELFCLQFDPSYIQLELFCFQLELFAYSGGESESNKHIKDCKQRGSTVSKKAPNVRKKDLPNLTPKEHVKSVECSGVSQKGSPQWCLPFSMKMKTENKKPHGKKV